MAKLSYREQLLDPRWQRKRLEILARDGFRCQNCGTTEIELHAHHRWYVSGRNAWEYPGESLITVCKPCHDNHPGAGVLWWESLLSAVISEIRNLSPDFESQHASRVVINEKATEIASQIACLFLPNATQNK